MRNIPATFSNATPESKRWGGKLCRIAAAAIAALWLAGCETGSVRVIDTSRTFDTVVVDAGHGGGDLGARSRWGGQEKTAALEVARKLDGKLQAAGFKTVMTRSGDYFVELNKRAAISNRQDNAIFVSVHFNHAPSRKIRGAEVYYKSSPSRAIAGNILSKIDALPGATSRGVKTANFRVLKRNKYPAVLVECGFLSNPSEGGRCATPAYREKLAGAIAAAIVEQRGALVIPQVAATPPTPSGPPGL